MHEFLVKQLANQLHNFYSLPFYVLTNPVFNEVSSWYKKKFQKMQSMLPIKSDQASHDFLKFLQNERYNTYDNSVELMCRGVKQLSYIDSTLNLDPFFNKFFFFRIGQRLLLDHYLSGALGKEENTGCIQKIASLTGTIQELVNEVRNTCRGSYVYAPLVTIEGNLKEDFYYPPDHVNLILTEVLKNSLRSTIEFALSQKNGVIIQDDHDFPTVNISIAQSDQKILLTVHDRGGGISDKNFKKVFTYGYSSAHENCGATEVFSLNSFVRSDVAGFGFGLPLARTFSQFFKGDLQLHTCHGIETHTFITLPNLYEFDKKPS
ncbi:3-methyl-2-oxobutanoate dehydrogenase [lipoamide] kinase, mitochondrial-like isoform X2 [Hylaeus volcanicus]|nr:3-methyl-2-oxobutanoate dehydrogenase [lipoamide] kinase, mitochondrial-like isoform X2 [Hylaeus volcanicus]